MKKLYCLTFFTQPNDDYRENFHIGLFWTYDKAKEVELFYRNEVPGFKDYDCEAEITEVTVIGEAKQINCIYRYQGWNVNEDFDEVDIIESDCYVDYATAENHYYEAQKNIHRNEWVLNRHIIEECDWKEGYVRY